MVKKYFTEEERKEAKKKWGRLTAKKYRENHKKEIKEYYENHKEKIKNYKKEYLQKNKTEIKLKKQKHYQNNKKSILMKNKLYRENHKKETNERTLYKLKTNINFKLAHHLRTRLRNAIHRNQKIGSAVQDLGCTIPELKTYLQSNFQEGMTWENWSLTGWHIDHIQPLDFYNLQNRDEFLKACHYTNLQPLWAEENLTKSSNIAQK